MEAVTLHIYWQFGTTVRYLQDVLVGRSVHGAGLLLQNIDALFTKLEQLELRVTMRAADELRKIQKEYRELPVDTKINKEQADKLRDTINSLRNTLEAELKGRNAYIVSEKRIDVERLVTDVSSLLAPGVFKALSEICRLDLSEAARCIAFERPTAAAFHLMRATEEALRTYYCHFVRRDRMEVMLWGPMVKALQQHRRAKKNDILHKNLDNIRVSFRNPTQHPDKIYDIQEAQDLWSLSVEVINRIDRAIKAD